MKVRVFNSDGVYRGGLFRTDVYCTPDYRSWEGPPNSEYYESLVDISGVGNPCQARSFIKLRISRNPEIHHFGEDENDYCDAASQAWRVTPTEARDWLTRNGFTVPDDLKALLAQMGVDPGSESGISTAEPKYMPARWFGQEFGIPSERLRAAHRSGKLPGNKSNGRMLYSIKDAQGLWPADMTPPQMADFKRLSPANRG